MGIIEINFGHCVGEKAVPGAELPRICLSAPVRKYKDTETRIVMEMMETQLQFCHKQNNTKCITNNMVYSQYKLVMFLTYQAFSDS